MKLTPYSNAKIEFDGANHCYRVNGDIKSGPSQLLSMVGLSKPVDDMPEPMRSNFIAAGNKGKIVHKWGELIDLGESNKYEPPAQEIQKYIDAWVEFKKDYKVEMIEIEQPHYSAYGDYCGTPDRIALVKDEAYVIDIKSSKSINPNGRLQTMAYTLFFKEPLKRMIVQLKDDGKYKIYDDGKYGKKFMEDCDKENWDAVLRVSHLIRIHNGKN